VNSAQGLRKILYTEVGKGDRGHYITLFMVLRGKTVWEERGTAKMIKQCLYVEFASATHDLIGLQLHRLFDEKRDVSKRGVSIWPGRKK